MYIQPVPAGTYIVSVSGGVDSVVLLDILSRQEGLTLVVAHIDHGIRADSHQDALLVRDLADRYGLPYEQATLKLGSGASEEVARKQRYSFLHECRKNYNAAAIIMAHHQDDILETMIINMTRGTGWRGLASLRSHKALMRPLLGVSKSDIIQYATQRQLEWHEDVTNEDLQYLRNYVRHTILPKVNENSEIRQRLLKLWADQVELREEIPRESESLLDMISNNLSGSTIEISRYWLIMAPSSVAKELLRAAIDRVSGFTLENTQLEKLLLFAKTAKPHKKQSPTSGLECRATINTLIVETTSIC